MTPQEDAKPKLTRRWLGSLARSSKDNTQPSGRSRAGTTNPVIAALPKSRVQKNGKGRDNDTHAEPRRQSRVGSSLMFGDGHRLSIVLEPEEIIPEKIEDSMEDRHPPRSEEIVLSSRMLEGFWDRYENARRDAKHSCLLIKEMPNANNRAHVSLYSLTVTDDKGPGGGGQEDRHEMFVVWSEKVTGAAVGAEPPRRKGKEVAGTSARETGTGPTYVSYFSGWEEGVLLALIRRGVKAPRTENEVIPFLPSRNKHAIITFDPDEWIVYRQFVSLGFSLFPSLMPKRYIRSVLDLLLPVGVVDKKRETTIWYNPDDPTSAYDPDALFKDSLFVMDEMQCYTRRQLAEDSRQRYSVSRLLDLNSDLEVTSVLYDGKQRQETMCFKADEGAILILLNRRYRDIAYVMKPSASTQRIVCRFEPEHWDISHVVRSSRTIWEKASRYLEGPDKECKVREHLELDRFVVPDSEEIKTKPPPKQVSPRSSSDRRRSDISLDLPIQGTATEDVPNVPKKKRR